MKYLNQAFRSIPLSLAAFVAVNTSSSAITIGFESDEGYSVADLGGQPSAGTKWTSSTGRFAVTAESGNNVLTAAAGVPFQSNAFAPTTADLGGVFDKDASSLDFSFEFRRDFNDEDPTSQLVHRFIVGGGVEALRVDISDSGRVIYSDGTTGRTSKTAGNDNYELPVGQFVTISGTIDFAGNTYTLIVDGVQQLNSSSGTAIAFRDAASSSPDIVLINNSTLLDAGGTYSLDNITLTVPEPGSVALAGSGLLCLLGTRRRRDASS